MPFSNNNSSSSKSGGGFANRSSSTSSNSSSGRGFANRGSSSPATKKKEEQLPPFDTSKVDKSIENAQMRIKDAGGEIDPDKRNWFEKLTNLPEGQNALFDAFDIIGRPQQALHTWFKGKLDNKPGAEIEKETIEAFKGKSPKVTGSDLAREYAGIDNKYGSAAAGFAWDVASDPTNLIPVGAIAKGISKGVGFGSKAIGKVADLVPGVRTLKDEAIVPAANALKEGLGNIFKYQHGWDRTLSGGKDDTLKNLYNQTENDIKYMSENSLRDVTQAARESGGVSTGESVGRLAEKDLKQFEDVQGYEFPDGIKRTENKQDLLDAVTVNRSQLRELGKQTKDSRIDVIKPEDLKVGDKVNTLVEKIIPATKKTAEKIEYVKPKNSTQKEIAEIRSNNGALEFRLEGEQSFVPSNLVRGTSTSITPIGALNRAASEIKSELNKANNDLRKMFISTENKKLKSIISRQKPVANVIARRGFQSKSPAVNLLQNQQDDITKQLTDLRNNNKKFSKKQYTPEQMQILATQRSFRSLSPSPAFNYLLQRRDELKNSLDGIKNEIGKTKSETLEQIKNVSNETSSLKESIKNPVMIQKEFERPVRQMPTDPKVIAATQKIVNSNETLRKWATDNDIPIGEIEGYMRHILSAEEQALRKTKKGKALDRGTGGMNNPDKGVLKGRELLGSVEDINERLKRKFFEPNAYFATAVGQKKLIDYGNAVKFRREVLKNTKFAKPIVDPKSLKKGEAFPTGAHKKGDTIPEGAEVINLNNYTFTKPGTNAIENIGGEYIVTKGVKQALDRYQHLTSDEGIKAFLKGYDTVLSGWKRLALFSGGYHVRNAIGAMFNNYVTGMDVPDIVKYSTLAAKEVKDALKGNESKLYDAYRRQGLSSSSQSAVEFAKHGNEPEKAITNAVKDQSRTTGQKALGAINPLKAFDNSQKVGNTVDQVNRFALFKWAVESKGMTPEQAAAKVRETQFDYSQITKTEKEVFTRLMPFYRWSRNNIPFQLRKFAEDPARYSRVDKLRRNAQDSFGLEEEDTPDFMKQNFFMPVTSNGDGTGRMFGANLPVGDLTRLSSPGKLALDSLTTALKLPIELTSNRNLFFNNDIQRFEGQEKKYQIPNSVYGLNIPVGGKELGGLPVKLAYGLEQAGGQVGRSLANTFGKKTVSEEENASLKPTLGMSSMLKKYDIKETNLRQKQAELRKLMDYIDYLEQEQGERARSVNDIKKDKKFERS